jgi:hypothetical protein
MPVGNPTRNTPPGRNLPHGYFRPVKVYGGGSGQIFEDPLGNQTAASNAPVKRQSGSSGAGFAFSDPSGSFNSKRPSVAGQSGGGFSGGMPSGVSREGGSGPRFNPLLNFMDRNRSGIAVGDFRRKLMQ